MAANLFSKLERFCEESQVMAAHWWIAQIDNHQSVSQSARYVGKELLWQLKIYQMFKTKGGGGFCVLNNVEKNCIIGREGNPLPRTVKHLKIHPPFSELQEQFFHASSD